MKIYKVKSEEDKGYQQCSMVSDCIDNWYRLNNKYYPSYTNVMNMKTNRVNDEHYCYIALTYHLNLNKW